MLTTKTLYTQVLELIHNKARGATAYLSRANSSTSAAGLASMVNNATTDDVLQAVSEILGKIVESRIISGLSVTQTTPPSNSVIISAGTGTAGGKFFSLNDEFIVNIPFTADTYVYYINLYSVGIRVENKSSLSGLTIAKIISPYPDTVLRILDKQSDMTNGEIFSEAYIQSFKQFNLYGMDDKFEEDTIELLRDNIGEILADNLIGNIRLSENLKITNSSGALEMNSTSIKMSSPEGSLVAEFNDSGTYFYDENGTEIAKFATDGAKIGNIVIEPNLIRSSNFSSGTLGAGFQITDAGEAEFNNVRVRGVLSSSVFEKDTVSTIGGSLLVLDGDVLAEPMSSLDNSTMTISGATTFAVNDILRIKDGLSDEWFKVTNVSSAPTYVVERDKAGIFAVDNNVPWPAGATVVNYGVSGKGGVYLTASEEDGPYVSIFAHEGEPWTATTTYTRLGNLNGFLGYTEQMFGIALGDIDNYLKYDPVNGLRIKGSVIITGGNPIPVTFYQDVEPGSSGDLNTPKAGDYWVNTSSGLSNPLYIYQGGVWTPIAYGSASGITDANGMICAPATPAGAGLYLGAEYMGYFDGGVWSSYIKNDGTFYFGADPISGESVHYIAWNGNTLDIRGCLNADDLTAGTICGLEICGATIYGTNVIGGTITGACIQTGIGNPRTAFDAYSISSYDVDGIEIVRISDGCIRLSSPECECNYTYLSSGTLRFHDVMGDFPYAKRISSGIACTGDTICLPGWRMEPKVLVSIAQLQSYNSSCSAACQSWRVYNDTPVCFSESGCYYGYCFAIHACLYTAASTGATCLRDINFGTSYCTESNTCLVCVRHRFQLWCNAACANFYAGCLCYNICYRICGAATWCACSYTYLQAHSSTAELQCTCSVYTSVCLPSGQVWELMSCQTGLSWHDTGIATGTATCYLCTRSISGGMAACGSGGISAGVFCYGESKSCNFDCNYCCQSISVGGSVPAGTICSWYCVCHCVYCLQCSYAYGSASTGGSAEGSSSSVFCAGGASFQSTSISASSPNCCNDYDGTSFCQMSVSGCISGYYYFHVQASASVYGGTSGANAAGSSRGWGCFLGGSQYHCYCVVSGSAACCTYTNVYTNQNTYNSSCTLDPAGCLNWIAIGYD